ncbi:MAG TPA: acyl-CoA dehydrogenase family protein [Syntrophomonadaceae bacterium]|jgi:alkylation response protein AidB-like acyl-CoA dehydrogenase|nr:acyl-CoA dehydrogenase family protein [Syntrophomonadaceae bacterium]
MDFNKSEEHLAIEASIEKFARNEMAPLARELDEKSEFPMELWRKMGQLGYCGLLLEEKYGGSNLGAVGSVLAMQAAGRGGADQGTCLSWASHMVIASLNIQTWGTEEQKEKYLPKMASGEWIGAMALTEPGSGSDASSLTTRATLKGDKYILNGTKMFITNGPICEVAVVIARTDPEKKGASGCTAFIVDRSMPGWYAGQKLDKMGMRASPTSELVFENCEVPVENVLGPVGMGMKGVAFSGVNWERTILAAPFLGGIEYNLEQCIKYAKEREQFGRPIASFQAIQHKLAEMAACIEAAKLLVYRQAWMIDHNLPCIKETSLSKFFLAKLVGFIADEAVQIHGGYGLMKEYPVERFFRDWKLASIGGGTSEVNKNIAAQLLLK